jgi:hypothetical protein
VKEKKAVKKVETKEISTGIVKGVFPPTSNS